MCAKNRRTFLYFIPWLIVFCANGSEANEPLQVNVKGQVSTDNFVSYSKPDWRYQSLFRYIPDLTLNKKSSNRLFWDLNISYDAYLDYSRQGISKSHSKIELYRLNSQIKTKQSDVRIGLQKINYGPALLLRSLRWFDQLDPRDPLQRTEGIWGLRYRYFYMNNSNLWLWGLYGNDEAKGYELVATKKHTPEVGVRLQYPVPSGEVALSLHSRKTERTGFTNEDLGRTLMEKRLALDGKWDYKLGMWFEFVSIDQGAGSQLQNNWVKMLTLGADYTFAVGNGLHVIFEHLSRSTTAKGLEWNSESDLSAVQLNYPIGLVDAVSLLQIISWDNDDDRYLLRWNRTYDNVIVSLGIFVFPDPTVFSTPGNSGSGFQFTLILNH